jgi:hypothetical protein
VERLNIQRLHTGLLSMGEPGTEPGNGADDNVTVLLRVRCGLHGINDLDAAAFASRRTGIRIE